MNKPKAIGTQAESAVVKVLNATGWPLAERRILKGALDEGDITGTPALCWEVKGGDQARQASDALILEWLAETETERKNANAEFGILVVQRKGVGLANAGRWWAVMWACDLFRLHGGQVSGLLGVIYTADIPIRLLLADAVTLLRMAGYGNPLPNPLADEDLS
ncbi:hypothetical protein IMZ11_02670 [Microtetraspora sp. AC03309]|nr:hypothetical protein [Microtetraspora sp. AC03309]